MVVFEARGFLLIAALIWGLGRLVKLRRGRIDLLREAGVIGLFLWSLVIVRLTFFPLNIVFYDWHGTVNLVPFASIVQLLRETSSATANYNIVGNIVLFVPLGFFLPALFAGLRRLWPVTWRAAAISLAIEVAQVITRARSSDIDDVVLNTLGAAIGFGLFSAAAAMAIRTNAGRVLLERLGSRSEREPLLGALIPVGVTAALVVPMMLSTVFAGTLGDGPEGILGFAVAAVPESVVVSRADIAEHTFVVVREGSTSSERLQLYSFERVLPGRYTWVGTAEIATGMGSRYAWSITAYNSERNEIPAVVVWGTNRADARSVVIRGNGVDEVLSLPAQSAFAITFSFDVAAPTGLAQTLEDFAFTFRDRSGNDVTNSFELAGR